MDVKEIERMIAAGADELARLQATNADLLAALDHSCLRELFGEIEDSGTPEAARLWSLCLQWFDVRDAAFAKAKGIKE